MSERFFANTSCRFFPCHQTNVPEHFHCLFCYCPLYPVHDCPGEYVLLQNGLKDCSNCLFPHDEKNCEQIFSILRSFYTSYFSQTNDWFAFVNCREFSRQFLFIVHSQYFLKKFLFFFLLISYNKFQVPQKALFRFFERRFDSSWQSFYALI